MAAVTYEFRARATRPVAQSVYWRRRLVALVLFAGLVLALATMAGRLRSVPHAASEPRSLSTELVGRRVHIVHNWSWLPAHVKVPFRLADALDGSSIPAGAALNLGAWDVRVFFTD